MSEIFALAVRCDGETNVYQLTYDITWENLEAMLKCVVDKERILFKYVDEENDEVCLNSEAEWVIAKDVARKNNNTLNITLEVSAAETPANMTETPPEVCEQPPMASAASAEGDEAMVVENDDEPVVLCDEMEKDAPLQETANPKCPERMNRAYRKLKHKRKHYYASLAEEVGKSRAKAEEERSKRSNTQGDRYQTDSAEENEPPPKWFKQEWRKMVPQIVQGVLRGLNGAVIDSIYGTRGIPFHAPPPPPPPRPPPPPPPPAIPMPMPMPTPAQTAEGSAAGPSRPTYCHVGIICDNCDRTIVGVRYKCGNCSDYDLCEECESLENVHDESHVFLKLKRPAIAAGRQPEGHLEPMLRTVVYNESQGVPPYVAPINWWHKKMMRAERKAERKTEKKDKKCERVVEKMKRREETLKEKCERKMEKMKEKFERREEKMKRRLEGREGAMPSKKEKTEASMQEGTDEETVPLLSSASPYAKLLDKMDARFLRDGNMPDDTHVQPGTKFIKHWVMENQGTLPWNAETRLKLLWGSIDITCSPEVEVPPLSPGQEGTVSVGFEAPKQPGQYQSHWRMCQGEEGFGHRVWCSIIVDEPEMLEPTSQSVVENVLVAEGEDRQQAEEPQEEVAEVIEEITSREDPSDHSIGDEENCRKGSCESISAQDMLAFELLDIQESSTPNNTPIDMTPRISPLPLDENLLQQQISKCSAASSSSSSVEIIDTPDEEQKEKVEEPPKDDELSVADKMEHLEIVSETGGTVDDDTASEFSHLSDDTLEDFCIVPLPECFDRTIPLDKSMTSSQMDSNSISESSFADTHVEAPTEAERISVDDMMATSQPNAQPEPLIPVTLTSNAAPTMVSTITVAISPIAADATVRAAELDGGRDEDVSDEEENDAAEEEKEDRDTNDAAVDDENQNEEDDKWAEATGDTPGDQSDDAPDDRTEDRRDGDEERHDNGDEIQGATGGVYGDEAWREEPAFDPVKAMEYAGGLAVQAFSAAARTGSHVVSAILSPKPPPARSQWPPEKKEPQSPMDQLIDMGFCNRAHNTELLAKHDGDVARVVQELLADTENDWHANRH